MYTNFVESFLSVATPRFSLIILLFWHTMYQHSEDNATTPADSNTGMGDVKLLPGNEVFGVAHLFASFNDTFVHIIRP
jgi:hypothetical protein